MYYSNYIELHYYIHCTAMYCGSRIKGRSSLISVASRACMLHSSMYYILCSSAPAPSSTLPLFTLFTGAKGVSKTCPKAIEQNIKYIST